MTYQHDQTRTFPDVADKVSIELSNVKENSYDSGQESLKEPSDCQNPHCIQQRYLVQTLTEGRHRRHPVRTKDLDSQRRNIIAICVLMFVLLVVLSCIPLILLLQRGSTTQLSSTGPIVGFDGPFDHWLIAFKQKMKERHNMNNMSYYTSNLTFIKDLIPTSLNGTRKNV